ncbi:unnamed protein product [Clonostachys rosea]|uniref:Zn(2)-C6 fungal-type domain-containing protein n=1 Tax=Bionectria ochroleuca TaxID=29856 RepID=A0ABY6UY77_BIOOC|nr:unnamed protein product [Clonostachys rosea]
MEVPTYAPTPLRKQQTCDKCYLRKIKCDRQQPRCSQCVADMSECTYKAPSRPSRPRKRPAVAGKVHEAAHMRAFVEQLQSQVADLTKRLDETTNRSELQKDQLPALTKPTMEPKPTLIPSPINGHSGLSNADGSVNDSMSPHLNLPPFDQVMPVIQMYLDHVNSVTPLFHPGTLLGLVNDFYEFPNRRDTVSWAAINIVLALTYRQVMVGGLAVDNGTDLALGHLNKAQSVISDVLLSETKLLHAQVLLGIATMLQISKSLQPAMVIMGAAMRLVRGLGLHTRASTAHLDTETAKQHTYVFWIAYILDKDISMRMRSPSIHGDDEVDVDMPVAVIDRHRVVDGKRKFGDGVIATVNGNVAMDFLLTRIRLAIIEGGVYDYLYSVRSQARSPEERNIAISSLVDALQEWQSHIAPEFDAASAAGNVSPTALPFICSLHATSFACLAMINEANAWSQQWVISIRKYPGTCADLHPRSRWEPLVEHARDFAVLFESIPPSGYALIWETICAYLTAVMLVAANNAHRPFSDNMLSDMKLTRKAVQLVDDIFGNQTFPESGQVHLVRNACADLNQNALRRWYEKFGTA